MLSLPPKCPFVPSEHPITHAAPDSPVARTPELLILLLAAVLTLGAIALGGEGGGGSATPSAATASSAHVRLVERRVEALRGLRFRRPVPVAVVSPAQARRDGLAETDRSEPAAQRRVD